MAVVLVAAVCPLSGAAPVKVGSSWRFSGNRDPDDNYGGGSHGDDDNNVGD
ncbi:hypothetical protein L917_08273 [Phytophthora nicotianae]|uniref:RxLR effector protein n=3 Tax=Phytophthora nicotianae TaxID=4792 RepID=V9F7N0_PHYNI|nr:hypothetical protein F443_08617 [Phytophthora nicotianae P1569]ETL93597.1 hypothetical protein L917_08273 [Phytophthora nicotianae]ETM56249.1 hypothetical protein L914_00766 [Phytophthora nicotianae]ETO85516.1 hypothetical protein F444_00855 [Phytophthora nicotianae P1976]